MMLYRVLADIVVVVHAAYVTFVIVGLLATLLGTALRWGWIRNFWFRVVHLAMVILVAAQAVAGVVCPLTTLENFLRSRAGQVTYPGSFVAYWAHELIFYDAPTWVFTVLYCLFATAVLATWLVAPPLPRARRT